MTLNNIETHSLSDYMPRARVLQELVLPECGPCSARQLIADSGYVYTNDHVLSALDSLCPNYGSKRLPRVRIRIVAFDKYVSPLRVREVSPSLGLTGLHMFDALRFGKEFPGYGGQGEITYFLHTPYKHGSLSGKIRTVLLTINCVPGGRALTWTRVKGRIQGGRPVTFALRVRD